MEDPLILDRYKPLNRAGAGGSGVVEICWDTRIQRRVAIKRIPLTAQTPLSGEGIPGLAEARTAALLKHPAIVDLIDFETQGDEALIIMEAVEGPSLAQIIDETPEGELDWDIITTVIEAMASALDFAHENQVLHLDIKPDNILIDRSGRPKVSDFGIAELADAQGFGQACGGTIGYMPPEQIIGDELDQRCDLFAFASCIYEMIAGSNPFFADDLDEALELVEQLEIDLPSDLRDDIDPDIDDVLLDALQPDREQRPETVADFMEALEPFLGDAPIGQAKLFHMINPDQDEDADEECDEPAGLPADRALFICGRACAGLLSWWVAAIALMASGLLSTPLALAGALVPGVAAAFLPSIGSGIALLGLGAAVIYQPNLPSAPGIILILLALAWWFFIARRDLAAVNCSLSVVPLGLVWFAPFAPLLAGRFLRPLKAAATAAFSGYLMTVLSLIASSTCLLHANPLIAPSTSAVILSASVWSSAATWLTIISWIIAAYLTAVFCSNKHRFVWILGALLASLIMFGMQILVQWLDADMLAMPSAAWCISLALACAAAITICAIRAFYTEEGES